MEKALQKPRQMLPARRSDVARAFPELPLYLTADEAHKILSVITRTRDELLFRLLWETGLRISEALAFTTNKIRDGNFHVRRKGGKVLPVVIPPELLNKLFAYAITEGIPYDQPLFPISRQQAWRLLQRYARLAGIERRVWLHLFRHGFAVNVLKQIPNLPIIQDQLGHKSIETTRRYIRVILPDVKEVLGKIIF